VAIAAIETVPEEMPVLVATNVPAPMVALKAATVAADECAMARYQDQLGAVRHSRRRGRRRGNRHGQNEAGQKAGRAHSPRLLPNAGADPVRKLRIVHFTFAHVGVGPAP